MSYKNTDLKRTHHALKVIRDGMVKAKACQQRRKAENESFARALQAKYPAEKYSKTFYESQILPTLKTEVDAHNIKALADFKNEMEQTADDMLEAVKTLKDSADFRSQALDFSDPTLINALKMLDAYGKDMPLGEQINLVYTFAGDMPALRAIENGMKKNGMR